jgi:hypothetical protein
MTPLAILITAAGGTVAALAVSSAQRSAKAAATERILERMPAPPPPAPKPKQLPAPSNMIPAHVVEVVDKPKVTSSAPQLEMGIRAPRVAAQDLFAYVTALVRAGKGDELGSAATPNSTILAAQNDMRLVKVNGVYDAPTRARGKELIGREFPQREQKRAAATAKPATAPKPFGIDLVIPPHAAPAVVLEAAPAAAPPPPSAKVPAHAPREAAEALLLYVGQPGADFGSKASPSSIVRDAQKAMGGITADGVYGPKTGARIAALTGKAAPQRAAQPSAAASTTPADKAEAAEDLIEYLSSPGANFGTKSKPSAQVRDAQKAMGLTADGIYGPKTAARIEALTDKRAPARS